MSDDKVVGIGLAPGEQPEYKNPIPSIPSVNPPAEAIEIPKVQRTREAEAEAEKKQEASLNNLHRKTPKRAVTEDVMLSVRGMSESQEIVKHGAPADKFAKGTPKGIMTLAELEELKKNGHPDLRITPAIRTRRRR